MKGAEAEANLRGEGKGGNRESPSTQAKRHCMVLHGVAGRLLRTTRVYARDNGGRRGRGRGGAGCEGWKKT